MFEIGRFQPPLFTLSPPNPQARNGDLYSFGLPVPGPMVSWALRRRRRKGLPIKTLEGTEKAACGRGFALIRMKDGRSGGLGHFGRKDLL